MSDLFVILRCPTGYSLRRWILRPDGMIGVDMEEAVGSLAGMRSMLPEGAKRADSEAFGVTNAVEAWRA
jgi:hypothetical protein